MLNVWQLSRGNVYVALPVIKTSVVMAYQRTIVAVITNARRYLCLLLLLCLLYDNVMVIINIGMAYVIAALAMWHNKAAYQRNGLSNVA